MKPDWYEQNPDYLPPKEGEPPLFAAARAGDHAAIRSLVAAGADLTEVFNIQLDSSAPECPATPLMVAAGSGDGANVDTVHLLIELGADPRAVTDAGSVAAFACDGLSWNYTRGGDANRLRACLAAGSPLPKPGPHASKQMARTARLGDPERLRVMIEHGMSANVVFDPEEARQSHERFKEYMKRRGDGKADQEKQVADESELWKELGIDISERNRHRDEEMLARAMAGPSWLDIPLFQAAESGSAECVRVLLDAGADLHQRDDSSCTALWYAESQEVAQLLVERGLSTEDRDESDHTPLLANLGERNRVLALLAAGADANAACDHGYTALMCAVSSDERCVEVIRALVASGADPHAISDRGYNAFHAAIDVNFEANREESVRSVLGCLKELGVNIEHANKAGRTPLARAIEEGTEIEVRVLCELGANVHGTVAQSTFEDHDRDASLPRPLLHAALDAVPPHLKTLALLEHGADPRVATQAGFESIHLAASQLCADSNDYDGSFRACLEGLNAILPAVVGEFESRQAAIDAARLACRPFLLKFADSIPLRNAGPFTAQHRAELLDTIELLFAYRACPPKGPASVDR